MHALSVALVSLLLLAPALDGWLGVYLASERDEAVVSEVIPGSPAEKVGLQAGDVLLAVGDKVTATRDEFVAAIRAHKAGDRLRIKLRRGEQESVVVVKLGERVDEAVPAPAPTPVPSTKAVPQKSKPSKPSKPSTPAVPAVPGSETAPRQPRSPGAAGEAPKPYLGLSVRSIDGGVVVDRVVPSGPAEGRPITAGDRITSLGDTPVSSLADIDRILATLPPGGKVSLGLQGPDGVRSVLLTLGERPESAGMLAQPVVPHAESRQAPAEARPDTVLPKDPAAARSARPVPPRPADAPGLEAEIEELRQELRDLRRQLEELRRQKGRE